MSEGDSTDAPHTGTLRELRHEIPTDGPSREPLLFLALECDRPDAGGARHSLRDMREVRIGRGKERVYQRDEANGLLTLEVPDRWMSSAHARIVRAQGHWVFEDLGSTNGSSVDGVATKACELADGAILTVGHTLFIFRESFMTRRTDARDLAAMDFESVPSAFASLIPEYAHELATLARVARSELSILLLGETGSGKELLASAIHVASGRTGALVAVNCGALPESLVESQLFGHEKGAFSGAHRDALGLVRAADSGTLLLDEVGDLRPASQAALLRMLEQREVTPVGSTRAFKVDIQVISATHRPLDALTASDAFRQDLLARLSGFRHPVLPLRSRREDLGLILAEVVREIRRAGQSLPGLTTDAARAILVHDWPANIRELKNALAAGALWAIDDVLRLEHLPAALRLPSKLPPREAPLAEIFSADDRENVRMRLVANLEAHRGNITAVAGAMRTSRSQIHRWLKRFQIDPSQFSSSRPR